MIDLSGFCMSELAKVWDAHEKHSVALLHQPSQSKKNIFRGSPELSTFSAYETTTCKREGGGQKNVENLIVC